MKKILLLITTVIVFTGCQNEITSISKSIAKHNVKEECQIKRTSNYFHKKRKEVFKNDSIKLILKSDTFFLMETYDYIETIIYGTIWNSDYTIDYSIRGNENPKYYIFPNFSPNLVRLIEKWDIETIRQLEKEKPLNPITDVYITRKIGSMIDVFSFGDFFY